MIGGYCPDQWEDTTGKKNSNGILGWKDIVSGSPFLFYFLDNEIQIIKHRDNMIPTMRSDKDWLMMFGYGLELIADKNQESKAFGWDGAFVHP